MRQGRGENKAEVGSLARRRAARAGQTGGGDGIFRGVMSAEATSAVTADVVQLRMKIFLRSPLRRKLLARSMRLLDQIKGQEVLETTADDALGVAMQNAGGGGGERNGRGGGGVRPHPCPLPPAGEGVSGGR